MAQYGMQEGVSICFCYCSKSPAEVHLSPRSADESFSSLL